MTVASLRKYKTFLYNERGKPVAVQLDLRNKTMKKFFETMMEDFEDTMDAIQALKEDNGTRYTLKEVEEHLFVKAK
jgi:ribosomal protein L5